MQATLTSTISYVTYMYIDKFKSDSVSNVHGHGPVVGTYNHDNWYREIDNFHMYYFFSLDPRGATHITPFLTDLTGGHYGIG